MHNHDFGTCPECGSPNLDYGDITWNDMFIDPAIQQEITCEDCGCNFNEIYNVKPDTVDIIWHGNKHKNLITHNIYPTPHRHTIICASIKLKSCKIKT